MLNESISKIFDSLSNADLEADILSCILLDDDKFYEVEQALSPRDFYRQQYRIIYETISGMMHKGGHVDVSLLMNQLQQEDKLDTVGGAAAVMYIATKMPTTAYLKDRIDKVAKFAKRRKMIDIATELAGEARDMDADIQDIVGAVQEELSDTAYRASGSGLLGIAEAMTKTFASIEDRLQGKDNIISTGFQELDRYLGGGFSPENLVVIGARPAVGKSDFCLNMALDMAKKGKNILYANLEMSAEQTCIRLLSHETGIDSMAIRKWNEKNLPKDSDFNKLLTEIEYLNRLPIELSQDAFTVQAIASRARMMKAKQGLDVLFVDHLQILDSTDRYVDDTSRVTALSKELKHLASSLGIVVVALSQLSRAKEQRADKKPQLSDLRQSGSIEQDADAVILLDREEASPRMNVHAAKVREGMTGEFNLMYSTSIHRFAKWDFPNEKEIPA